MKKKLTIKDKMNAVVYDLVHGHPKFMQDFWATSDIYDFLYEVDPLGHLEYPTLGGDQTLKEAIIKLHSMVGNSDMYKIKPEQIVIGNGASQILFELIELFFNKKHLRTLGLPAPFWYRFREMAHFHKGNLAFPDTSDEYMTNIIVSPNNPTNIRMVGPMKDLADILDASYNWPQYGRVVEENHPLQVYSFSKAFGLPGIRVGWAIIKDHRLAEQLAHRIEVASSGVSTVSQAVAEEIIRHTIRPKSVITDIFEESRKALKERWKEFTSAIQNDPNIEVLNDNGMFAWCFMENFDMVDYMRSKYGIEVLSGAACGVSSDYMRINIGGDAIAFKAMCRRLRKDVVYKKLKTSRI
jgi:aspartate/methionine/tyrosine aminotransferase